MILNQKIYLDNKNEKHNPIKWNIKNLKYSIKV